MSAADEIGWEPERSYFDRLLRRLELLGEGRHGARRTILAFIIVGWIPLVLLELLTGVAWGHLDRLSLNPAVHARLLIAIPAYLIGDRIVSSRTSACVRLLEDGRLIDQVQELHGIVALAARLRDSVVVEVGFLLAAITVGQLVVWTGQAGLLGGIPTAFSAGLVWYGFVSLPIFLFLLARLIWRWVCWSFLLWRISRLRLRLVEMHADRTGGLGFLVGPSLGMGIMLLGSSAVISAGFAERMLTEDAQLASFGPEVLLLIVIGEFIALGPLLVFYAQLISTRFLGIQQYGSLGIDYARSFHRKWIESATDEGLLGTSDIQSLADIQNAYRGMEEMRPLPFGKREMLLIGLAVFLPMLPLLAIAVPLEELLSRLVSAIA